LYVRLTSTVRKNIGLLKLKMGYYSAKSIVNKIFKYL